MRSSTLLAFAFAFAFAFVVAIASTTAHAAPCANFDDVDDASPFCANVVWMKNRGITLGCAATSYCPGSAVTRLQLAVFMNRLADSLFPLHCSSGQVMKWSGSAWACANDASTAGVTSVVAGTGLAASPAPITGAGTLSVAGSYQLPQSCGNGQVPKSNGAGAWTCAADSTVVNAFVHGGNAFNFPAMMGTTTAQSLELRVGNERALLIQPAWTPNIVGGHRANATSAAAYGVSIGGGGGPGSGCYEPWAALPSRPCANRATDLFAVVGGGYSNRAGDDDDDADSAAAATVAGGDSNTASAMGSAVGGGIYNIAGGPFSAVIGGSVNTATGSNAAIAAGSKNVASGDFSFAAGTNARADQPLCAVFSLWDLDAPGIGCLGASQILRIGARHGFSVDYYAKRPGDGGGERWLAVGDLFPGRTINAWNGAHLTDAGVWVGGSSSRSTKTDFAAVDHEDILRKVAEMPILTWRYRQSEGDVRHIGPMAEDFHAAFGVGYGPHTIADLDARGVALAAIQGLNAKLDTAVVEREAALAEHRRALAEERHAREVLARELASLREHAAARITRLERMVEQLLTSDPATSRTSP